MADKKIRSQREIEENQNYIKQQVEHCKTLEEIDRKKEEEHDKMILEQLAMCDKQLKAVKQRQKKEKQDQIRDDIAHNERLKKEQAEEAKLQAVKKVQEKEYLFRMLQENKLSKQKALDAIEKERLEDIKAQELHAAILAKQEEDRMREIKAREERQQMFMNRMADTVIKEMDNKAQEEEMKIRKWELQRELAERQAEERRQKKKKEGYEACKRHLFIQMEEKKKREIEEHERNQEQAHIWAKDRENMLVHEKQVNEKVKKHNHDTAEFLRT